jgi:hypothetical protein
MVAASISACASSGAPANGNHDGGGGVDDAGMGAVELLVRPADTVKKLAPGAPFDLPFTAFAVDAQGGQTQVAATFAASGDPVGSFAGNVFHATGAAAGVATITASYAGLTATTTLTITISLLDLNPSTLPSTLIGPVEGGSETAALDTTWQYPEDATLIPPNVYDVAFAWKAVPGADAYLLVLSTVNGKVRILSSQPRLVLDHASWDQAMAVLGSGTVLATAYSFAQSAPTVVGKATRTFHFSSKTLQGALYYWSSASGLYTGNYGTTAPDDTLGLRGYFRYDFSKPNPVTTRAELFFGFSQAGNQCVGCHAISKDGSHLSTSFEGDSRFGVFSVATPGNPVAFTHGGKSDANANGNFSAFTPDGHWLITTSNNGLQAYDVSIPGTHPTGTRLAPLGAGNLTTHVAISPADGTRVYYVEGTNSDTRVHGAHILFTKWNPTTTAFENQTAITALNGNNQYYYYPAVSPDGNWLMFNVATTNDGYSNPTASVYVIKLDASGLPTGAPIALARANQATNLTNSWPRWAPFVADDGEGHPRYYLTFSSTRAYVEDTQGHPQLWLASFDPAAPANSDPSGPALWVPAQSLTTGNHAAQWTEVFVGPIQ